MLHWLLATKWWEQKVSKALPWGACFTDQQPAHGIEPLLTSGPDQCCWSYLHGLRHSPTAWSIHICFDPAYPSLLTLLLIQSCILCRRRWRESVESAAEGGWEIVGGSGWEGGGEQEGEEGGGGEEGEFVEEKRGENWRAGKRRLWTLLAWCRSKWCFLLEQELQQRTKKYTIVNSSTRPLSCYCFKSAFLMLCIPEMLPISCEKWQRQKYISKTFL